MTDFDQYTGDDWAGELLELLDVVAELLAAAEGPAPPMKHLRSEPDPGALMPFAAITDAPRALSGGQLSESTRENYLRALGRLKAWMEERGVRYFDDRILSLYLAHLYREDVSASLAGMARSAVVCLAGHLKRPSPVGGYTNGVMAGYRKQVPYGIRGPARLVSRAAVRAAARAAESGSDRGYRDAALICVLFDGLLQASEAANLQVRDLEFAASGSVRLHVKARNGHNGRRVPLRPDTVRRLRRWLSTPFALPEASLFPRMDKWHWALGSISRQGINQVVRERFAAVGVKGVVAQSLRAGGARSLAMDGASIAEIQQAGGWRSPTMPMRYARSE